MKKISVLIILSIIGALFVISSCSMATPAPEFVITSHNPLAFSIDATTTWLNIDAITIENTSNVDMNITGYSIRFFDPNGNSFAVWPSSNTPMSLSLYIPGKGIVDGVETTYTGTLENFAAPIVDDSIGIDIYNTMLTNNWDAVTMRVTITGEDAYGYDKQVSHYTDFGIVLQAK